MKVKCINNGKEWRDITISKTYEVIDINQFGYLIINDCGHKLRYEKECFKTLSEIRNEKIDKLLE